MGAVTPLGPDLPTSSRAASHQSGLRPIPILEGTPFEGRLGAPIIDAPVARGVAAIQFAKTAIDEALEQARPGVRPRRTALIIGTSLTPEDPLVDELAATLRRSLGEVGTIVVSTACVSGLHALLTARTLLQSGRFDCVIAGGTDEIALSTFAGFHALGLLCSKASTPFGAMPDESPGVGTNLGEGAAFFVLERRDDAVARQATILATIEGMGVTSDAHHATSPHPSGDGLTRAAEAALREADRSVSDVAFVSAHGTGTRANDEAEYASLVTLFGARSKTIPITVTKSLVGHSLGAASAIELALALESMGRGELSPSARLLTPRSPFEVNLVTESAPVGSGPLLKLGAAFGGFNAAAIISTGDVGSAPGETRIEGGRSLLLRRPLAVLGMGGFGGPDPKVDPLGSALDLAEDAGTFDFESLTRGIASRGVDRTTQILATAFHRATRVAQQRTAQGHRTATFVGQRRASPENGRVFTESVDARGYLQVSGSAFARKVLNTATGAVCRMFALRGPTFVLTTGAASGLVALTLAADHLALRDDADLALAAGVEERDLDAPRAVVDGAACFVLGRDLGSGEAVLLTDWAIGASVGIAAAEVLERSNPLGAQVLHATEDSKVPAVAGLLACGVAIRRIERGDAETVIVLGPGRLASACVMFQRSVPA